MQPGILQFITNELVVPMPYALLVLAQAVGVEKE